MEKETGEGGAGPARDPTALTSYHVRCARAGDRKSLEWVVTRFSPLLLAAARYRLGNTLRAHYDPEDIVSEVWGVAIPRLGDLLAREERFTPVLMRFLSSTLLFRIRSLARKHVREGRGGQAAGGEEDRPGVLENIPAETTGILHRLVRKETEDQVAAGLGRLEERDREILILRGIEGHPYKEISVLLREDPKSLAVRYQRALGKLRKELPGSVYEELEEA